MPSFLNELAKPQPVPGGGAAAAQGALTALALLVKVLALEGGRKGLPLEQREAWRWLELRVRDLRKDLGRLRRKDGHSYLDWQEHRGSADKGEYARNLVQVPLQILSRSREALELLPRFGRHTKRHLWPDLLVVAELLRGGGLGAARIAAFNLALIKDETERKGLAGMLDRQTAKIEEALQKTREILADGR